MHPAFRDLLVAAAALSLGAVSTPAAAGGSQFCSSTATTLYDACKEEADADSRTAKALCINVSDDGDRAKCLDQAKEDLSDARGECKDKREARLDACDLLGEDRYDPDFTPSRFDKDFTHPSHPNPWFPLKVGNHWSYAGGDEVDEVEVLDETKSIEGVTCVVVHDLVTEDGEATEDTDDWFAQRKDATVHYCGESSQSLETFDGDDPETPELVSLEGSWKTGRDGSKSGTILPGQPAAGMVFRQEFAPGTAEDISEILTTTYAFGQNADLDAHVPRALARLFCSAGDCVVTREINPNEPGFTERKYYARGIGVFLEVDVETGDIVRLTDCNFDSRCNSL